jgi:hypothetical protein
MITIDINGTKYSLKSKWNDITIEECQRLEAIEVPERFVKLLRGDIKEHEVTYEEQVKTFPQYFGLVLCELGNIPTAVINRVNWSDRTALYTYVSGLLSDIQTRSGASHHYTNKTEFEHNGITYRIDEECKVLDALIPMPNTSAVEFVEQSDLLIALNNFKESLSTNAAMLCAIALRDRSNEYNEREVLMLAEQFKTLKMSDFWEVFFSLNVHTIKRALYIAQSLTSQAKAEAGAEAPNCLSMNWQQPTQPEPCNTSNE